jgi:HYR domain
MSNVTVLHYRGQDGSPGTNGVNPGDSGGNGGYGAPIAIQYSNPSYGINVVGGAGGAGGNGASGGNAGAGGSGGYARARSTVAADSNFGTFGYAAAFGGAGGNSGQYSSPGYGADGGDGGFCYAYASSANATGLADAEADAFGGAGGAGQNGAFSGAGGTARARAYASGLYAAANVYQRGGRGGDGINGGAGGTGAASTLTNAVGGHGVEYLKLSQTAVGGAGGSAAFGAPTGFGGDASSKLTYGDYVAPTFFGRSAAYGGAGGGGNRGSFSLEGGRGYASIELAGQNFVDGSAYATGGAGGGAYVPGGVNYQGFGAQGGEATGAHASVVAQGTAYARAVGTGGAGGSAYGAGETAGDGGVAFGETAYASGISAIDTVTQTGGAGGYGFYRASGGTGQNSILANAVNAKGDFLQLKQTAVGGAGGGSYLGTAGHGGTGFSGFIFDDTVNGLRASSIYGKSTARGGAGGGGGGGSNGAAGGNAFAAVRVTGRTSITAHALATGGSGGAAKGGFIIGGDGGAGGIAYGAHATAIALAPTGGATYAGTNETGGSGGGGDGNGHTGGAGGAAGGSLAYASGYSASVVVQQTGGAGGTGADYAQGGAGGNTAISNAARGRSTGGYVKLIQTATGGAGGSSNGGDGGLGGSASSALSFDDTTNPVAASSLYGRSTATGGAGGDSTSFTTVNGGGGGAASASVNLKGANTVDARAYAYGGAGGRGLELGQYGGAGGVASGVTAYGSSSGSAYSVQVTALQQGGAGGGGFSRGGAGADSVLTNAVSGRTSGGYLTLKQTAIGGAGGYSEEDLAAAGGSAESVFSFDDTTNPIAAISVTGNSTALGGAGGTGKYGASGGVGGGAFARAVVVGNGEVSAHALATGGAGGAAGHEGANGGAGGAVTGAQAIMAQAGGTGYARADETGGAGGVGYGPGYAGGAGGAATGSLAFGAGFSATVELYQTGGAGGSGMAGAAGGAGGDSVVVGRTGGPISVGTHGNPPAEGVSGATTGGFLDLSQTATGGAGGYSSRSAGGVGGRAFSSFSFDDTRNAVAASSIYGRNQAAGGAGGSTASGVNTGGAGGTASGSVGVKGSHAVTAADYVYGGFGGSGGIGGSGGAAIGAQSSATSTATIGRTYARSIETGGMGGTGFGPGNRLGAHGGAGGAASGSTAFAAGYSAVALVQQTGGAGGIGLSEASGGTGGNSTLSGAVSGQTGGGYLELLQTATGGAGGDSHGADGGRGGLASSTFTFNDTTNAIASSFIKGVSAAYGGKGGKSFVDFSNGAGNGGVGAGASATIDLTGTNIVKTYADAVGGAGGVGYGSGHSGGNGGNASASHSFASGHSARAAAYQRGGSGGGGGGGANGGAGAASILSNAVSGLSMGGYLTLNQVAVGGAGGYSIDGIAGAGGAARSTFSFDDGFSPVAASSLYGRGIARGGAGGNGSYGGAGGGAAYALVDVTGTHSVKALAGAYGGAGGQASLNGVGGAGGAASEYAEANTIGSDATSLAKVTAGAGGNGSTGGAGGAATGAIAKARDGSLSAGTKAYAKSTETAGAGGRGSGSGQSGGSGGAASGSSAFATGFSAQALVYQTGGAGGRGTNGASGGAGGDSALAEAAIAYALGGYLNLLQVATGGRGGDTDGGLAGKGGSASSALAFAYFDHGGNPVASKLTGRSAAVGGAGGSVYLGATIYGPVTGGAGGSATATADLYQLGSQVVSAEADSTGGAGGFGYGAGQSGGAGGVAHNTRASAVGQSVMVSAQQIGGAGGLGLQGAAGGVGADSTLINAVSGRTAGGYLDLFETAVGGAGGSSYGSAGGAGGSAYSSFKFDDTTANPVQASSLYGRSAALGGAGGDGYTRAGTGGAATAKVNLKGASSVSAVGYARGGQGGSADAGGGAAGGNALAQAYSYATSLGAAGTATAQATAFGGAGSTPGAARALSQAATSNGQLAQAISIAQGGGYGIANAVAFAYGSGIVRSAGALGFAQLGGPGAVAAIGEADAGTPFGFDDGSHNSYSFATALPSSTYVASALQGHANVDSFLGAASASVFGAATQGDANSLLASGQQEYQGTTGWVLDGSQLTGDIIIGLLGMQSVGSGFDSLTFFVDVNASQELQKSFRFTSLGAAKTFFTDHALDIGHFTSAPGDPVTVSITFDLFTSSPGSSFGYDYLLGTALDTTPPVLSAVSDQTDEATSAAGAVVRFAATATDAVDGTDPVVFKEGNTVVHSGDTFGLGTHTITASATDAAGNTGSEQFTIKVEDTTAPVLTPVADQTDEQTSAAGAVATFAATATDVVDGTDPVVFTEGNTFVHSGDAFSLGTHTITASATDAAGNTSSEQFTIKVVPQAPPVTTVPGDQLVQQGANTPIGGISVADADADTAGEIITVVLSDAAGILSATGPGVSSPGTTLTISGSLTDVNTELGTLNLLESGPGSDMIDVSTNDGRGGSDDHKIAVSINSPVVVAVAISTSISPVEGAAFDSPVATFTSSDPTDTPSSFTATVDWGDGTVEAGTVTTANGGFAVSVPNSLHSYADEGDYTATVTVTRAGDGRTRTGSGTITVAEGDVLTPLPLLLFVDPNKTLAGNVAFFSDTVASPASDFTATIDWGDGATATGVVSLVNGTLTVSGTHTYAAAGVDPVDVTLTENAPGMATATSSATAYVGAVVAVGFIGSPALITTEGTPFSGQIATFRSSNLLDTTASYMATIDWGDGTTTPGTISGGNGSFFVSAPGFQHIYADEGAYDATVTVTRGADHTSSTASGKITVLDADTLSAVIPVQAVDTSLGQPFNAVATFIDTPSVSSPLSQLSPASDFTATFDWGDGTTSSGMVSGGGNGFGSGQPETFTVSGSHTYTTADRHFFTVTLTDDAPGGTTATSSGTVYVGATLGIVVDPTAGTAPPPVEHHLFSGQVATFTSTNPLDTAASYSAVIDWGDGMSAGTITQGNGDFIVSGQHTYFDDGDYPMKVTVVRMADGTASTGSSGFPIRVGDDDVLTADPPVLLSANPQFSGFVATFDDTDTVSQQSDFIASIDWGDGTSTMGGVSGGGGTLAVSGSHTYAATGQYKVTATLGDDDGGAGGRPGVLVTTMVVETLSVALSGSAREGSTLIATPTLSGNISGSAADVTYQWMRGGSAIAGATSSTYQLTEADELSQITVQASFADPGTGQTLHATSNQSGVVLDPPPALSVSILGTAQENQTLQAIAVASSGDANITYQWQQLNGLTWVNIAHATGATYQVVEPNENHQLRLLARSSDPESGNASATSAPTALVIDVTPTISVTISGAAQEGQLLSATALVTTDGDGGRTTYQWEELSGLHWFAISGATNANFRPTEPLEGHALRVTATFTDDTGQSVSATSDSTAPVTDLTPALTLTVTGIAQEGRTLTAHPHITSDADGGTTTYQWQRLIGTTWTDIVGAQASTYQVSEPDEGFALRATAIFTDDTGQTAAAASDTSVPVIDIAPTLSVSISGTAQDGQTLLATATANDADAGISLQWQQLISGTWTDIAGATASSYQIDDTNEGRRLRVSARSADPDGGGITVNSAATAPVTDPPPTLTIASPSLFVAAGGSVALPISVTGFDADDRVSVTIAGLPTFETISDAFDPRTFAGASVSLDAAEVNSGLTLHSSYAGSGQPVNVLAVVATNTTAGESSTSPAQTIAVTDPPPANGAANATFAPGDAGVLWLDNSSRFNSVVAGLAFGNSLDLADITFGRDTTLVYAPNGDNTAGTLSASDGSHNANIALLSQYMASSFVMASDGHGGTLITDPPSGQTQILSQPHR